MPKRIKETRSELSTLAAEQLAKCPKVGIIYAEHRHRTGISITLLCKAKQFRSLLGLAIGMDQTKGQSKPKRKRRKPRVIR